MIYQTSPPSYGTGYPAPSFQTPWGGTMQASAYPPATATTPFSQPGYGFGTPSVSGYGNPPVYIPPTNYGNPGAFMPPAPTYSSSITTAPLPYGPASLFPMGVGAAPFAGAAAFAGFGNPMSMISPGLFGPTFGFNPLSLLTGIINPSNTGAPANYQPPQQPAPSQTGGGSSSTMMLFLILILLGGDFGSGGQPARRRPPAYNSPPGYLGPPDYYPGDYIDDPGPPPPPSASPTRLGRLRTRRRHLGRPAL